MDIPSTRLRYFTVLVCLLFSPLLPAQMVIWPGDINDNGVVNGKDVLRWGYAYGTTGPARPRHESAWKGFPMPHTWTREFPGETNFAYGDCDGNGIINNADLNNEIDRHFGQTHGALQPDFCPIGIIDVDPQLQLTTDQGYYAPGQRVDLHIWLGTDELPLGDFYGISMRVTVDEDMIKSGAVTFSPVANPWYDAAGTASQSHFFYNKQQGEIELTLVRTDQQGVTGFGRLGVFSFVVRNEIKEMLPTSLPIAIDLVQLIDSELNILPVAYENLFPVIISDTNPSSNCPQVIEPVCGSDGNTYLNSCYAEAAGVSDYTTGVCYSDCIDPDLIEPDTECATRVEPVCGCNEVTYINPCEAEAAGVLTYSSGPCNTDGEQTCYDPILVVQSSGTTVDASTGVISLTCTVDDDDVSVCGCNGITFPNACVAEASGIAAYTIGNCDDGCIDPEEINPGADCSSAYAPVCGCNEVTYTNACAAEAAGVQFYTSGVCGQNSSWCDTAIPIQCGDFLAQESTIGAGNHINQYPNCSSHTFAGADQVYVFDKTTAGDLQIGLEIMTPGVDLDLFLLAGDCEQIRCLRSSKTNNETSNNEGIVLEDAPLGTYYIVVDAQFASAAAEYRLELSCGYLYCGDALELDCGVPFKYNNSNGRDDVSLYACGSRVINVENNGPEIVHYFTTTSAGEVEISLTDLSANLELILLRSCDRGDCIKYSQLPGTSDESLSVFLEAGTYYIVVDGYNGATSNYTLQVDCANTCDLSISDIDTSPSTCDTNTGTIEVTTSGGTPGYLIYFEGPISGNFSTSASAYAIVGLPPGAYTIRQIDSQGCEAQETVTIYSTGELEATITPSHAICQEPGYLSVNLSKGQPPYRVYLTGPQEAELSTSNSSFRIPNLKAGTYSVYIVDDAGCSITRKATIQQRESNFSFTTTSLPAGCGALGTVRVTTQQGEAPYVINLDGPVSGNASADNSIFNIDKLPGGTYRITITDANGCSATKSVTVGDLSLDVDATPTNGICGELGSILVQITQGNGLLTVNWNGPVSGTGLTTQTFYLIPNLPSGSYQIEVIDGSACVGFEVVTINNDGENLATQVRASDGICGEPGALLVDINNGQGPYTIIWDGPVDGRRSVTVPSANITGLPDGLYKVTIADRNGCSDEHSVYINTGAPVSISLTGFDGSCGQKGSIRVALQGGSPNYIINWSGPENGSQTVGEPEYELPELPSGTYLVAVTDRVGCTDEASVTINNAAGFLNLTGEVTAATCALNGAIDLTVSGGAAPYDLSWEGPTSNTGQTDNDGQLNLPDLPPGSYQLIATDQNGCTGETTIEVTSEEGNMTLRLEGTDQICTQPGQIAVHIQQGRPNYSVRWEGPESGERTIAGPSTTLESLPAGNYSVTVVDQIGCQVVSNITLQATGEMEVEATALGGACGRGSIEIIVRNGAPTYELSWDGPVDGSTTTDNPNYNIVNLPDGTYTIEISDNNGCTDATQVQLFSGSTPLLSASPQPGQCGALGAIGIDISDGVPAYQLSWTGPVNGNTPVTGSHHDIDNLPSGNYRVIVTDDNGCQDQIIVTLSNQTTNLSMNPRIASNECGQQNTVRVDISGGVRDYQITWSGPQNGSGQTSTNRYDIEDLSAGNYNISVTDDQGCQVVGSIAVQAAPINLLTITPRSGVCSQPGSVDVRITGGTPTYTITWTGAAEGSTMTNADQVTIPGLPSGDYSLVLTDANGCSDTRVFSLDNETNDLSAEAAIIDNECGLPNTIRVAISGGSTPYTVQWTGSENGSETANEPEFLISDLPGGSYDLRITDSRGCIVEHSLNVQEVEINLISLSTVKGKCGNGGTINVGISGGTAPYQITWTGPASGSDNTEEAAFAIDNLASGDYTVELADAKGCTDTRTISLRNTPALQARIVGEDGDCFKDALIRITVNAGSPAYSITWTGPMSGTTTTTDAQWVIEELITGIYEVTVKDAQGCEQSNSITVLGGGSNFAIDAVSQAGTCGAQGKIDVQITGGSADYTINWQGPEDGSVITNGQTYSVLNLPGGNYEIEVRDRNGCDARTTVVLPEKTAFTANVRAIQGDCDELGDIRIELKGRPPYTLSWSGAGSGTVGVNNSFYRIPDLADGIYDIEIIDADDCVYTDQVEIENIVNDLSMALEVLDAACNKPGAIRVNIGGGTGGFRIEWGNGDMQRDATTTNREFTIPDLPEGTYLVRVQGNKGCMREQEVQIRYHENPLTVNTIVQQPVCDLNGAVAVDVSGVFPDFTIAWSGPTDGSMERSAGTYSIDQLPGGVYSLNISDSRGCTYQETITLATNTDLQARMISQDGNCDAAPGISIQIDQGAPGYTIAWSGPTSDEITIQTASYLIDNLEAGDYNVRITDNNGCTYIENVTLQSSGHQLSLSAAAIPGDCGEAGMIDLTIGGPAQDFRINWSGPVSGNTNTNLTTHRIENLPSGSYTIGITDEFGCHREETIALDNGATMSAILEPVAGVCDQPGSVEVSFNEAGSYALSWTGPSSGLLLVEGDEHTISSLPAGDYTIEITDSNDCTYTEEVTIDNLTTDLQIEVQAIAGRCDQAGAIDLSISGGQAGFQINWSSAQGDGSAAITENQFRISELTEGNYTVLVTDANGCSRAQSVVITQQSSTLVLTATAIDGACGQPAAIDLAIQGANNEVQIDWTGPVSGTATTDEATHRITGLPAGTFTVLVTDENGCEVSRTIEVANKAAWNAVLNPVNGNCDELGAIDLEWDQAGSYTVKWTGPNNGQTTVDGTTHRIPELASGMYDIEITDMDDCAFATQVNVTNAVNDLALNLQAQPAGCDQAAEIRINISGGVANYMIQWKADAGEGTAVITSNAYTITEIEPGDYVIQVTDSKGCATEAMVTLTSPVNTLDFTANVQHPECGEVGTITVDIQGGVPDYTINWSGPAGGFVVQGEGHYVIDGLLAGSYLVEVIDGGGCTRSRNIAVTTEGDGDATFTHSVNILTVDFSRNSIGGNVHWDFGDGSTSTENNPTYEYCEAGTYTVCTEVTDACGTSEHCESIQVSVPDDVVILDVGEHTAGAGSLISIPVTIENCSLLVSLAGTLQLTENNVGQIMGVSAAKISPQYNPANRTFNYFHNGGEGVSLSDGDTLFYWDIRVTGAPGSSSDLRIINTPLKVEVGSMENDQAVILPHLTLKGKLSVAQHADIAGRVHTYWGEGIADVSVNLEGVDVQTTVTTDGAGIFNLPEMTWGQEYTLSAEKDKFPFNGLSTFALFIGQRFILGMQPSQITSPYQIIAGDANCNGSFTTLDLFIIQQLIIGATDDFRYCPSWVFVSDQQQMPDQFDAYNVFPYLDQATVMLTEDTVTNFVGVKVGDILGHANPAALIGDPVIEPRSPRYLTLQAVNHPVQAGELIDLTLTSAEFEQLVSYQFTLGFDQRRLSYVDHQAGTSPDLATVAVGSRWADRGHLGISWYSTRGTAVSATADQAVLRLQFRALEKIDDLSELLWIADSPVRAEAHTGAGDQYDLRLGWQQETSRSKQFRLYQNVPNPVTEQTRIDFDLPLTQAVQLTVYDKFGRVIWRRQGNYPAGRNRIELDTYHLPGGVYHYTLQAGPHMAGRSMIILE